MKTKKKDLVKIELTNRQYNIASLIFVTGGMWWGITIASVFGLHVIPFIKSLFI